MPSRAQRPVARWFPAIAAIGVLLVVLAAATFGGDDEPGSGDRPTDNSDYFVADLTVPASASPGLGTASTAIPIVKTTLAESVGRGNAGPDVVSVQTRLADLGFAPGAADGSFGDQTEQAVWAFEKLVLGTPRAQATGLVTNDMWQRMQDPIAVLPRRPGVGTHVEIYLPEQVAAVFTDNVATLVIHISSGTDEEWCEDVLVNTDGNGGVIDPPVPDRYCGTSKTPGGVFQFERAVSGHRVGALGGMDNPIYFNFGIAMHGSGNVPLAPASHGCIRMHKRISESFQTYVHIKDRVYVWGQDGKQPEEYTKAESLPVFDRRDPTFTTTTSSTSTTSTTTIPESTTTTAATTPAVTTTAPPPPTTTTTPAPTTTGPPTTPPQPAESTTTAAGA